MADFRKISVLVALVLLLGVSASAQTNNPAGPFSCIANAAVPPTVRAEGMAELVGDIVLACTGGIPTAAPPTTTQPIADQYKIPRVNFTVFLNTNITSRSYVDSTTITASEALLLVDEPGTTANPVLRLCATPLTGCEILGTGTTNGSGVITPGPEPYNGDALASGTTPATTNRPNAFRGIVTGNQVQFIGVPVDAPGTAFSRVFRITNIRANASGISAGPSGTPGSIQALISASGSTSVPINNPTQIVGFVQTGLAFTVRQRGDYTAQTNVNTNIGFPQCSSLSRTTTVGYFLLEYREGFPSAFKTRGTTTQSTPGAIYNTESGFTNGTILAVPSGGTSFGYADSGTKFKATFTNIPAGVNVYVSTGSYSTNSSASAKLVSGEVTAADVVAGFTDFLTQSSGTGGPVSAGTTRSGAQIAVVNGSATAVWEVTGASALETESLFTIVWFNYSQNASQNSPPAGTASVNGSFAPTATGIPGVTATQMGTTSTSLPVPRFVDSVNSRNIVNIYLCRTNLLFPFVTNQAGFDTGLAIANTSLDTGIFFTNTATQSGACNVYPFGDNAPASFGTGTIAPGKVWVDLASTKTPNFQGYLIAQCTFQFAHGFAFISDFGARNLAMGYLALIIPDQGNNTRAAPGTGESLMH